MKPHLLFAGFLTMYSLSLFAQSGSLDPSFSEDGIDIRDLGANANEVSYAGKLQPDGKILLAGWSSAGGNVDFAILRYLEDGTPDPDFGTDGIVLADFEGLSNRGYAIAVQPDGKIIVAGSTDDNSMFDFSVLRLLPDGTTDSTFGHHGWVITDLGTLNEYPNAVALQADGKIIVAGRVEEDFFSDFGMVRYHADGQLDTLFGEKGIVITDFREEDQANDILIQPDGKIILGGFSSVSASGDFALARYNTDGSLDKLFGEGGKVLTDLEGFNQSDFINDLVLLNNGKILAAGNANNNNLEFTSDIGLVKYEANGNLDTSFGENGVVVQIIGGRTNVQGIDVQQDGKIILCGESDAIQNEKRWFMTRYGVDGILDSTFAVNGLASLLLTGNSTFPNGVYIQSDSKIVVTGTAGSSPDLNFVAARFVADFVLSATTTDISCYGSSDGMITIDASGGIAPYLFSLDGIAYQKSNVFTGLAAGAYSIFITDDNGMGVTGSMGPIVLPNLQVPPDVDIDIQENLVTIIVADGGTPPFQYSADGGLTFTPGNTFIAIPEVPYNIVVIDNNGCILFDSTIVVEISATWNVKETLPLSLSPNPTSGNILIGLHDTPVNTMQIHIFDLTGRMVFTGSLDQNGSHSINLSSLDNGSYILWVRDRERWAVKKLVIEK